MNIKAQGLPLGIEFSKITSGQKQLVNKLLSKLVPMALSWDNVIQHWIHSQKLVIYYTGLPGDTAPYNILSRLPTGSYQLVAEVDPSVNSLKIHVGHRWQTLATPEKESLVLPEVTRIPEGKPQKVINPQRGAPTFPQVMFPKGTLKKKDPRKGYPSIDTPKSTEPTRTSIPAPRSPGVLPPKT